MWRYQEGAFWEEAFPLPEEERFLLVVNGKPWASFSYTPGDEAYLALGHLFLSGVLGGLEGVRYRVGEGVVLVDLPGGPERGVGVRDSGCAAGLRYGEPRLAPLPRLPLDPGLPLALMAVLRQGTALYARTRGIHGAAFLTFLVGFFTSTRTSAATTPWTAWRVSCSWRGFRPRCWWPPPAG